jgi:hypothetical protein
VNLRAFFVAHKRVPCLFHLCLSENSQACDQKQNRKARRHEISLSKFASLIKGQDKHLTRIRMKSNHLDVRKSEDYRSGNKSEINFMFRPRRRKDKNKNFISIDNLLFILSAFLRNA